MGYSLLFPAVWFCGYGSGGGEEPNAESPPLIQTQFKMPSLEKISLTCQTQIIATFSITCVRMSIFRVRMEMNEKICFHRDNDLSK